MSKLPFELILALRYLRPKRSFVSIITLISIFGVMLGVAVLIIVISVMSGFDHDLREKVFGFASHLKVEQREKTLENYAYLASVVASNKNVIGVAPSVTAQVMLQTRAVDGESQVGAPFVRGVDPETEGQVSDLPRSIVAGKFDVSGKGLILGRDFADRLRIQVGDIVQVRSPKDLRKMEESFKEYEASQGKSGPVYRPGMDYEVRGIFQMDYYEFDSAFVLASLENAQSFYGLDDNDSVHCLLVKLRDPFQAGPVARQLEAALGPDYVVSTWMENSLLMLAVMVEKNMMLYILFFIVIVAAFGITCTLISFIVMKTREIGVMKAIGATSRQIMWVFMAQSLIVSILGVLAGLGLGLLAVTYRNEFLHTMRHVTGAQLFPSEIYGFSKLPALILPHDLMIICGGSLIICLLAAAFPARYASKLSPVEALRHE